MKQGDLFEAVLPVAESSARQPDELDDAINVLQWYRVCRFPISPAAASFLNRLRADPVISAKDVKESSKEFEELAALKCVSFPSRSNPLTVQLNADRIFALRDEIFDRIYEAVA